jgi:hypothetical protein
MPGDCGLDSRWVAWQDGKIETQPLANQHRRASMGWTFRKRISLGRGLRINLGSRGMSISGGRGIFGFNTGQIIKWGGGRGSNPSGCGCVWCLIVVLFVGATVWGVGHFSRAVREASEKRAPSQARSTPQNNAPVAVPAKAEVDSEKHVAVLPQPEQTPADQDEPSLQEIEQREREAAKRKKADDEKQARSHLAAAKSMMTGNEKAGRKRLQEVIDKWPETEAAKEARKLLAK